MGTNRVRKPDDIAARIAALQQELVVSKQAEHDRMQQELLRLLDRTHRLREALAWARRQDKPRAKPSARAADRDAVSTPQSGEQG